jgi:hypothetical protein
MVRCGVVMEEDDDMGIAKETSRPGRPTVLGRSMAAGGHAS